MLRHGRFYPDVEAVQPPFVDVHVESGPDLEKLSTVVRREWSVVVLHRAGLSVPGHEEPDAAEAVVATRPTEGLVKREVLTSKSSRDVWFEETSGVH